MTDGIRYVTPGAVAFTALTVMTIIAVSLLIWLAAAGRSVLVVLPFSVCAWGGYLLSHYIVEGSFIDEGNPTTRDEATETNDGLMENFRAFLTAVSSSLTRLALTVVGVASMLLTFPTGIVAVGSGNLWLMFGSAALFIGGYIVGHQGVTGKPL
jgi:hypothetical protein